MIVYRALQGFIGGGMIPTVFAAAFTHLPARQAPHRLADHRPRRDAGADHRPDGRRLSHRAVLLALAVPGQCRARHHRHHRGLAADRLRQAGLALLKQFDWSACRHGGLPRARSNMCWRKARATTGCRTRPCLRSRSSWSVGAVAVLLARADARASRSSTSAPSPTAISPSARSSRSCSASGSTASPISTRSISAASAAIDALMIGETMFVTGLCMFLTAPIAGRLMRKIDLRLMMMVGFLGFARRHLVRPRTSPPTGTSGNC